MENLLCDFVRKFNSGKLACFLLNILSPISFWIWYIFFFHFSFGSGFSHMSPRSLGECAYSCHNFLLTPLTCSLSKTICKPVAFDTWQLEFPIFPSPNNRRFFLSFSYACDSILNRFQWLLTVEDWFEASVLRSRSCRKFHTLYKKIPLYLGLFIKNVCDL